LPSNSTVPGWETTGNTSTEEERWNSQAIVADGATILWYYTRIEKIKQSL